MKILSKKIHDISMIFPSQGFSKPSQYKDVVLCIYGRKHTKVLDLALHTKVLALT